MTEAQPQEEKSTAAPTKEQELQEAEEKLSQGVKLVEQDPEEAAELLSKALEIRNKHYGETAEENAVVYMWYGKALLEQARLSTEAFTTKKLKREAGSKEPPDASKEVNGSGVQAAPHTESAAIEAGQGAASASAEGASTESGEAARKSEPNAGEGADGEENAEEKEGKGEEEQVQESEEAEGGEEGESVEEEEEGGEGGSPDDLELAWEMLEMARVLCTKASKDKHASTLAEVHLALGDLSAEKEEFETTVAEYGKCQELLEAMPTPQERRLAEVHFKAMCMYELMADLPKALECCQQAVAELKARRAQVMKVMDTPVEGETDAEAEAQLEKLEKELDELDSSLSGLKERQQELKAALEKQVNFKNVLKNTMEQLAAVQDSAAPGGSSNGAAGPQHAASAPSGNPFVHLFPPSGAASSAGGPSGAASTAGSLLAPAAAPAAPVQNLGVVGRGRSRITLQPCQPSNTGNASNAGNAAVQADSAPSQKRSLADLIGGGGGVLTSNGFGAAATATDKQTGGAIKRVRVEELQTENKPIVSGTEDNSSA